jgi:hypothetical protein
MIQESGTNNEFVVYLNNIQAFCGRANFPSF